MSEEEKAMRHAFCPCFNSENCNIDDGFIDRLATLIANKVYDRLQEDKGQ